jgi:hypothetical protein
LYVPGKRLGIVYVPVSLLTAVEITPVSVLVAVTVTPGIKAFPASDTVPLRFALLDWPSAAMSRHVQSKATASANFDIKKRSSHPESFVSRKLCGDYIHLKEGCQRKFE